MLEGVAYIEYVAAYTKGESAFSIQNYWPLRIFSRKIARSPLIYVFCMGIYVMRILRVAYI